MKRILLVLTAAGLVLAPAAAAKGPHAILTTPRETVDPGKPWQFTLELNEFRHRPRPAMIGRNGDRTIGARVERTPASIEGAAGFRFTMIFPREGRWRLRMFAGNRRFAFPAVQVGGAQVPQDYVAFPIGSPMAGQAPTGRPPSGPANDVRRRRHRPVDPAAPGRRARGRGRGRGHPPRIAPSASSTLECTSATDARLTMPSTRPTSPPSGRTTARRSWRSVSFSASSKRRLTPTLSM